MYLTSVQDGTTIWMIPYFADKIMRIDYINDMVSYIPLGNISGHFYNGIIINSKIIIFPTLGEKKMMVIDKNAKDGCVSTWDLEEIISEEMVIVDSDDSSNIVASGEGRFYYLGEQGIISSYKVTYTFDEFQNNVIPAYGKEFEFQNICWNEKKTIGGLNTFIDVIKQK